MNDIYKEILNINEKGGKGVLITVVKKIDHAPAIPGAKMLYAENGQILGTIGGGALENAAIKHAIKILNTQKKELKDYILNPDDEIIEGENTGMLCGGAISLFFEYIGSGDRLYIFGAGHIGRALVYHLKNLNFFITLLDNRKGIVESVNPVQQKFTVNYENALKSQLIPENSYFIIASHSHQLDYVILKRIYEANWNPRYIGMVASKKKGKIMIQKLKEELGNHTNLDILYTPVGLNIGGSSPDEIAISIIAELQVIRYHLMRPEIKFQ